MKSPYNNKFDKQLIGIADLKWRPWIGVKFENSANRILVIGESHYQGTSEDSIRKHKNPDFTRIVVDELAIKYLTNDKRRATLFRNLNFALVGLSSRVKSTREKLWSELAFYNFIQEPMKNNKTRPSKEQINQGWEVFIELVKIIQPKKVLFIGSKVAEDYYKILKELNIEFEKIKVIKSISSRQKHRYFKLNINNKEIEVNFIKHTSSFFSWKKWNKHFSEINFIEFKH